MSSLIPLDDLLGALLVGVILSTIVYGITCMQVFLYFTEHCKGDKWFVKGLVTVVWTMDSLHVALLTVVLYHYMVTNFGDYTALDGTWSLLIQVIIGAFLTLLVQSFFAYRVYLLGKRRVVIPILIVCVSVTQTVLGTMYAFKGFSLKVFSNAFTAVPLTLSALASDLFCDCAIAAAMTYYLYNNRSIVPATNRIIHLLIKYTINTCLLEALCTIPCLGIWIAKPDTLVYTPFYFLLIRLYSCSLLCSLNNRDHLRDINEQTEAITMSVFQAAQISNDARKTSQEATQTGYEFATPSMPFRLQAHTQERTDVVEHKSDILV